MRPRPGPPMLVLFACMYSSASLLRRRCGGFLRVFTNILVVVEFLAYILRYGGGRSAAFSFFPAFGVSDRVRKDERWDMYTVISAALASEGSRGMSKGCRLLVRTGTIR